MLDEIERTLLFFSLSKITVPRAKWVRITQKYKELGGKCWQDCGVNTKMFWRLPRHELKLLGKHWRPFDLTPWRLANTYRLVSDWPHFVHDNKLMIDKRLLRRKAKYSMLSNIHSISLQRNYFSWYTFYSIILIQGGALSWNRMYIVESRVESVMLCIPASIPPIYIYRCTIYTFSEGAASLNMSDTGGWEEQ